MTDLSVLRERDVAAFDFRRPSLLSREDVRGVENAHEVFTRRLATRWSSRLRALVQVDPVGVDQALYDDYLRSMPNPNVLGTVALPPLPGAAIVELNSQLALLLVDRMLGGAGGGLASSSDLTRRPTDLEDALVRDLVGQAGAALGEALGSVAEAAELRGIDYNPQQVQAVAPSDMVVILTYQVTATQGVDCEGLLSLCYPAATLRPVLEHFHESLQGTPLGDGLDEATARQAVRDRLRDVSVDLAVTLRDSDIPAGDLARLRVGDVLRLDHPVGHPVVGRVGGAPVLGGHVGRRGRRMALQLADWWAPRDESAAAPRSLTDRAASADAAASSAVGEQADPHRRNP